MEFYDVHFSYIDKETNEERFISVPEQGGSKLIPEGILNHGTQYCITEGFSGQLGVFRFECQLMPGHGGFSISGLGSNSQAKESLKVAFDYFKANLSTIAGQSKFSSHDFHLHILELQNIGFPKAITLNGFISLCSAILNKPIQSQMLVLGNISLGGSPKPVINLSETLQVAFDAGAKGILLPMSSVGSIASVPGELFSKFQTSFYSDPVDAIAKALGVD